MLVFSVFFLNEVWEWEVLFFQIRGRYEGHRHFWVSTHDMGKSAISQRGNVGDQLSDPWCAKGGGKLEIGSLEGKVDICLGADG